MLSLFFRPILVLAYREFIYAFKGWSAAGLSTLFLGFSGFYLFTLYPLFLNQEATIAPFFNLAPLLFTFFIPALTMTAFTEEKR